MFGFLNPSVRDASDPLSRPKAAAAWLREMPSLDIVARQQLVAARLRRDAPVAPARRLLARAQALQYLDAALGADRRQLFKQYVESLESAPKVSERHVAGEPRPRAGLHRRVPARARDGAGASRRSGAGRRRCRSCSRASSTTTAPTPSFAYAGTSTGFPPNGWSCTARTCARASSASSASPTALGGSHGSGTQWTVEQEYVYALLMHQLNSGNLSPANLDWAASQMRAWSRAPRARRAAEDDGGLLRRPRRPHRARAPHRPGFGRDAALPRHDGARRAARHDARRAAPLGRDRPGTRRADQPAARD